MLSALFTIACTTLLISAKVAAKASNSTGPQKLGVLIFPGWEFMDVFAPLEVFDAVSENQHLDLYIISSSLNASLDPVSNAPPHPEMNKFNSTVSVSIIPTHTLAAPPDDLEVLLVPGGLGTSVPDSELTSIFTYIAEVYPKLHSLISPCTGVSLVARSGVLDGRNATTNKQLWASNIATRPQVNWQPMPRWVQDGNIWTAGGISASTDVALAWLAGTFGEELARFTANDIEYEWRNDPNWDAFAYVWGALPPGAA